MKRIIILIIASNAALVGYSQDEKPAGPPPWSFSTDLNFYFFPEDFIFLPVLKADKGKLHLEGRYNYEDIRTFSAWAGYNFTGGKKVEFTITPMFGVVTGNTKGVAAGGEVTLTTGKFELYSETEYLFDSETSENNFAYTWTDLTYSFNDSWWVGLSAQRTRLYKTNLDLQRGVLVGVSWKQFEATGYLYNLGFDTAFGLLTLTANF